MKVPFLDLKGHNSMIKNSILNDTADIINSGQYILGDTVHKFESNLASYLNVSDAASCNSGYDALLLSLMALELIPGDEVIVPAHTFIATWLAIHNLGLKIIPVDVEFTSGNLNPEKVKQNLSTRTRVIIAVHLYGRPVDLDPILEISKNNKIFLIEDAAQAIGSEYKGVKIGGHGNLVCWSFYPGKNLGGIGDGGAVSSNDMKLIEKIRILRNYGSSQKYYHTKSGINSRLNPVNAAILNEKLKTLDKEQEHRQNLATLYLDNIENEKIILPKRNDLNYKSAWHLFVIRVLDRRKVQSYLKTNNVETLFHYPIPCHKQPIFEKEFGYFKNLSESERWANECISLPISGYHSFKQIEYVIELINNYK